MKELKKIAITGPESTGKSMLAEQLAKHFNTVWVPEYAREYIDKLTRPYEQSDIVKIAKGQTHLESAVQKNAKGFLFSDTELIVTKIWSDVKYHECDEWILENIERQTYDLYLLCYIDLPWSPDPQREHPHMREHLFDLYLQEMVERSLPFSVVSGIGEERLMNAIRIIEEAFG